VLDPELPTRLLLHIDEKPQFPRLPLGVSANKHQSRATVEVARVEQKSETATAKRDGMSTPRTGSPDHDDGPILGLDRLITMANQIGDFFTPYPPERRAEGIRNHLRTYWDPRMRADLLEYIAAGGDGLKPFVRERRAPVEIRRRSEGLLWSAARRRDAPPRGSTGQGHKPA
jgi:hypothetical protein